MSGKNEISEMPNGIWLKLLICKSMYQKLVKIICLGAFQKKIKFAIKQNPIWLRNVPKLDKKNRGASLQSSISVHHWWKQGKMPSSLVWANQTHHNNTKEHKSL